MKSSKSETMDKEIVKSSKIKAEKEAEKADNEEKRKAIESAEKDKQLKNSAAIIESYNRWVAARQEKEREMHDVRMAISYYHFL